MSVTENFDSLVKFIGENFDDIGNITSGTNAEYIPQLANVEQSLWAITIISTKGEIHKFGETSIEFSIQSCCKPFLYAIASSLRGTETIHKHCSYEPSGQKFNAFCLTEDHIPHNPLINAGAIMVASLIAPDAEPAERFNLFKKLAEASGSIEPIQFDNSVFLSERQHADRNMALAYYMKDYGAFEPNVNLQFTLEFYFQACSICINTTTLAALGATLANQGKCCITQRNIFEPRIVRNTLALMYMCGMYNASGKFAFEIGLPAKSGVSGCLLLVIPGLGAIATYSPPLNKYGNSVRGTELFHRIAKNFPKLHMFENNRFETQNSVLESNRPFAMISASANCDINQMKLLLKEDPTLFDAVDYDGRSALHLAVSESQVEAVELLLTSGANALSRDRWGNTPTNDAINTLKKHKNTDNEMRAQQTLKLLQKFIKPSISVDKNLNEKDK